MTKLTNVGDVMAVVLDQPDRSVVFETPKNFEIEAERDVTEDGNRYMVSICFDCENVEQIHFQSQEEEAELSEC